MDDHKMDLENNNKKSEAFYRKFTEVICDNLVNNSVLDRLLALQILTKEEREDDIKDLSTKESRRMFVKAMRTKDYHCVPTLVQILEEVLGAGQVEMVNEMKKYLLKRDPDLAKEFQFLSPTETEDTKPIPLSVPNLMPNLGFYYVERESILEELHELVTRPPGLATSAYALLTSVYGLGGIGKTTLARRYVEYFKEQVPGAAIVWIESETKATLRAAFLKLAKHFGVPDRIETNVLVESVYAKLIDQRCLFVFDNVSDYEGEDGIVDFLPHPNPGPGHYILATSRRKDLVGTNRILQLDVLKPDEAQALVQIALPNSSLEVLNVLCKTLGCLPLGLQQAIAYILNIKDLHVDETCAIRAYLSEYEINSKNLLASDVLNEDGRKIEKTVYLTWQTTLSAIDTKENGDLAKILLQYLAYLNPDNIELHFLSELLHFKYHLNQTPFSKFISLLRFKHSPPPCPQATLKKVEDSALLLSKYSMITLHTGRISIHRLVQDVVRLRPMTGLLTETTIVDRIITHIEGCYKMSTDVHQCILHGPVIYPFYLKHIPFKKRYPTFSSYVFDDKKLIDFIVGKTSCGSNGYNDAIKLLQVLRRDESSIFKAVSCIKTMKCQDPLSVYVKAWDKICSITKTNVPKRTVVLLTWINTLADTKHTFQGNILRCLLFLHESFTTEFLAIVLKTADGSVRRALITLQKYGILRVVPHGGATQIMLTDVDFILQNLESDECFEKYLDLVLLGLDKCLYSSPECTSHIMNRNLHQSSALDKFPLVKEKIRTWVDLTTNSVRNVDDSKVELGLRLAHNFEYNEDVTRYILSYVLRLSKERMGALSEYMSFFAQIEHTSHTWQGGRVGIWERAKYINWMVASLSNSARHAQLMNALLLLDLAAGVSVKFLGELCRHLWPALYGRNPFGTLLNLQLVTIQDETIVAIEFPDTCKTKYFWSEQPYYQTMSRVVKYIYENVDLESELRVERILQGCHILRLMEEVNIEAYLGEVKVHNFTRRMWRYQRLINLYLKQNSGTTAKKAAEELNILGWKNLNESD